MAAVDLCSFNNGLGIYNQLFFPERQRGIKYEYTTVKIVYVLVIVFQSFFQNVLWIIRGHDGSTFLVITFNISK